MKIKRNLDPSQVAHWYDDYRTALETYLIYLYDTRDTESQAVDTLLQAQKWAINHQSESPDTLVLALSIARKRFRRLKRQPLNSDSIQEHFELYHHWVHGQPY